MESSTMTRQGGSGRPNLEGFPRGESGDGNGESEVGYHTQASLPDEPTSAPGPRKAQKRANFRGNKATICRIMSNLTQKEPKNKANFGYDLTAAMRTSPLQPENKANFGFSPLPLRERGRGVRGGSSQRLRRRLGAGAHSTLRVSVKSCFKVVEPEVKVAPKVSA